jgi:hypothetical protein
MEFKKGIYLRFIDRKRIINANWMRGFQKTSISGHFGAIFMENDLPWVLARPRNSQKDQ